MPTASRIKCLARAVTAAGIAANAYAPTKRASSSEMSELATDSGCGDLRAVTGAFIRSSLIGVDGHGFVEHDFFGKPVSAPIKSGAGLFRIMLELSGQTCARHMGRVNGAHRQPRSGRSE